MAFAFKLEREDGTAADPPDVVRKNLLAIEGDASDRPAIEGAAKLAS